MEEITHKASGSNENAYAGIPSFMRAPVRRDYDGVDVVIVGVPYDGGADSHRAGTRFGPRHIRNASLLMWGYNKMLDVKPLDVLKVVDYGDVVVKSTSIDVTMEAITSEVGSVLRAGPTVIALGGDHSISLPLLRAQYSKFGPPGVVHFDAHYDTSPGTYNHGTPFRYAIEEGLIDTDAYVQVGPRGPDDNAGDLQAARDLGIHIITIDEAFEMGIPAILKMIHERIGSRQTYVTLDIDSLDPAYAPGTGTPEIGGFTTHQMLQLVRGLRGLDLVGFDLVEVSPPYDHGEITAIAAANFAFEFLSLCALQIG